MKFPVSILPETAERRQDFKTLLELGLPYLWDGVTPYHNFKSRMEDGPFEGWILENSIFICWTVWDGDNNHPLGKYIHPMLFPHSRLDVWVSLAETWINWPAAQAHRKAWMLKLIGELS